ncbi:MAG: YgiQ family radical SAM protein, partial [Bacteroidetes bacterium RIFOXYA12_FULL_33_9]
MQQERNISLTKWLPTTLKEVKLRGWSEGELDVILFTGDAYVDHPSFGAAVIGRILENEGLKVAIVPQPNWQDDLRDFKKLGKPKLFFGVTSGNMDSMVNHYTANKRLRSNDAYTVGGKAGFRPDYATKVYSNILKNIFPEIPVIIGGIEASLRRFTHYDYWSDKLNPSILIDSKADLLLYGMSEQAIVEVVQNLKTGEKISELKNIPQTAFIERLGNKHENAIVLHRHEDCLASKTKYAENFKHIEIESNKLEARTIVQEVNNKMLVVNPPYPPMNETEFDKIFELPYTRLPHPKYDKKGDIPAYEMIKFSINIHRGCFGGCSFCTISAHQGKFIVNRSKKSIVNEID